MSEGNGHNGSPIGLAAGGGLVERRDQLDQLRAAFDRARDNHGSAVLVAGEPGIGKTTLVKAFQTELGDRARVYLGACEDMLAARALGPFRDIMRTANLAAPPLEEPEDRDSYIESMLDLMSQSLRPAVVIVEDAHWADDGSLDMIRYLGRRIESMPSLLVITYRSGSELQRPVLQRTLGSLAGVHSVRMELPALSDETVAMLAELAGAKPEDIVPLVAGNPFYLNEVLSSPGSPLPATVRDAVMARVLGLPDETRTALELLSVVPNGASLGLIESIVGSPTPLLEPAEQAGVILIEDGLARFKHELARLSVESSLADTRKMELHKRVLTHLTSSGADPATVVHHANQVHDQALIAEYGPQATDRAAFAEDRHGTVTLGRITLRNEDDLDPEVAARLHEHLAYALYALNRFGEASDSAQACVARWGELDPNTRRHANALLLSSRMHTMTGRPDAARAAIEKAREILEPMGPSRDLALAAGMTGNLNAIEARSAEAVTWCGEAIDLATEVGAEDVEALALIYRGIARVGLGDLGGFDDLDRAMEIAQRLDHGDFISRAASNRAAALIWRGRHREADPYLDRAEQAAREHGLEYLLFHVAVQRSHVELFAGRWRSAEDRLRECLATDSDPAAVMILPLALLGRLLVRKGEPEGDPLIERAWEMALSSRQVYRMAVAGAARVEKAWLEHDPDTLIATADILLPMAEQANLTYLRGEVLRYLQRMGLEAASFDDCPPGFHAALEGDRDAAIEAWSSAGNPYEAALEKTVSDDLDVAFEGLRQLDDLGASATAGQVRMTMRERGVTGIPRGPQRATREGPTPLTGRQLEILSLVAEGLTSPEIAERLFISRRTVDNHIAALVTRLDGASRAEAVDRALAEGWITDG